MKRILAFILTIIVAVAVFTPCCVDDDCRDELVAKQDAPQKSNPEGTCSPFVTCGTCHGFVSTIEPMIVPAPEVDHPEYFIPDFGYTSSTYATSPWQPPRSV